MDQEFWFPVQLSLWVSSVTAVIVLITGIMAGRLFAKREFKGKIIWETIFILPLVLPPSVIGFFLILLFGTNSTVGRGIETLIGSSVMFTPLAAVLAATVVAFPLMFQSAKAGFSSIDADIEGAAKIDGANEGSLLFYISIPLAGRALVTGGILSFTRALGEFGATLMFAGNIPGKTQTIPTAIYVAIESGDMTLAYTYVLISVAAAFILLSVTNSFARKIN
ncbi:molybdate ABC transporter permease subunit [Jeotgalibacillus sp. S-D1]|uniref:molybdate ABC transporter permease subunit n=1 Tax=Jeotgalibacillus sp. S-D1 TaxID=2552189 RepID=UPI00105A2420|nr:molybdate ABC transporter permease subunit [Jeotgalibacillus sp. S-D1]TDL31400.1 molybdate ABC transporter permease subunit [Jeotgalibacillus sp. S-D1]